VHNVAAQSAGAVPFGSASLPGYCSVTAGGQGLSPNSGIHCWQNINDGKLGNSHSWIPGTANAFAGVTFAKSVEIEGLRVSRKGEGSCCNDRISGTYTVEFTNEVDGGLTTSAWLQAGSFTRTEFGFLFFKFSTTIKATALRIRVSDGSACIDELEVYSGPTPVTLNSCSQADLPAYNVAAQSAGAIPFGSSSLPGYCSDTGAGQGLAPSSGIHCWQNINDGKLGNSYSWIPGTANAFVGVVFAKSVEIHGIRVSRKGAGDCCNDRIGGTYAVEYTNEISAGLATTHWLSAGSFTRNDFGFLFFKFSSAIAATAIRITVSDAGACIDELEAYSATGRRLADGFMV